VPGERLSIEVKVTDRCNQYCFHCMNGDGNAQGQDLDAPLVLRRLDEWQRRQDRAAVAISEVRMTGGEPLLVPRTVAAIGRACSAAQIVAGINTNASLLDDRTLADLRGAGLTIIKVSFDSLEAGAFRAMRGAHASLDRTIHGLRLAVDGGFHVIARFTLSAHNRAQLVPCYEAACAWGVRSFQVKPLIRSGRAAQADASLSPDAIEQALAELARAAGAGHDSPEVLCWPSQHAAGLPSRACGNAAKIYVLADGRVIDCNFLSRPPFADLRVHSLEEVCRRRQPELISIAGHDVLADCPAWDHWGTLAPARV
jgi:molybdenum cofactor biosynthesis enzyme MoaA